MATRPIDVLDVQIHLPLSRELEGGIISSFLDASGTIVDDLARDPSRLATYFQYYSQQRRQFLERSNQNQQLVLIKTHRDIANLIYMIKNGSTKEDIMETLREKSLAAPADGRDLLLNDTVDFVARLLLMIDIKRLYQSDRILGQQPKAWSNDTLSNTVTQIFSDTEQLDTPVRLDRIFIAPNIELIGDIQIQWTNDLEDHLKMSDDDKKVALFGHVQFLELAKNTGILPAGLAEETLQTLALLLPRGDNAVKKWFEGQQRLLEKEGLLLDDEAINGQRLTSDERQIKRFKYWHDRLIVLKQAFDEAQPKNLRQWWNDQRNPVQWYNFWVAVALVVSLTVFFGLVQSIEGALQVYKAYHPTKD